MKFNYQARTQKGEVQKGVVEASSSEMALQLLSRYGLYVTRLEQAEKAPIYAKEISLFGGVGHKDLMVFSRQMAIMFRSQVSLIAALYSLSRQAKNPALKRKLVKIREDVEGGTALSKAFAKHPDAFTPFYVSMIRSGEASGKLADVMEYLAEHLERQYELNSKVKGALYYPLFVLVLVVIVVFGLMLFVVPNFATFFEGVDKDPPLVTSIVFAVSDFFQAWWYLLVGAIIAAVPAGYWTLKIPEVRDMIDEFALRVPPFSTLLKFTFLARFAENLSTLINSGIPIVDALDITSQVVGNKQYSKIVLSAKEAVKQGAPISSILESYPREFPPVFTQMVHVGEESGSLDTTLAGVVQFYQNEVARTTESSLKLLEPMLIVAVGIIVGGIVASILLPMYQTLTAL